MVVKISGDFSLNVGIRTICSFHLLIKMQLFTHVHHHHHHQLIINSNSVTQISTKIFESWWRILKNLFLESTVFWWKCFFPSLLQFAVAFTSLVTRQSTGVGCGWLFIPSIYILNNYSLSPIGLWVNSLWGRRPNGLLTQRPWGQEE